MGIFEGEEDIIIDGDYFVIGERWKVLIYKGKPTRYWFSNYGRMFDSVNMETLPFPNENNNYCYRIPNPSDPNKICNIRLEEMIAIKFIPNKRYFNAVYLLNKIGTIKDLFNTDNIVWTYDISNLSQVDDLKNTRYKIFSSNYEKYEYENKLNKEKENIEKERREKEKKEEKERLEKELKEKNERLKSRYNCEDLSSYPKYIRFYCEECGMSSEYIGAINVRNLYEKRFLNHELQFPEHQLCTKCYGLLSKSKYRRENAKNRTFDEWLDIIKDPNLYINFNRFRPYKNEKELREMDTGENRQKMLLSKLSEANPDIYNDPKNSIKYMISALTSIKDQLKNI